jgi:hypothetical protein
LIESDSDEINFADGIVYNLKDILECIFKVFNIRVKYTYNKDLKEKLQIENKSNANSNDLNKLTNIIINEYLK